MEAEGLSEVLHRLGAQELTPKDIRALLLVRLGGPDGDGVRQRVLEHVQALPHLAVSVLSVHCQMAGLPLPQLEPEPINVRGGLAFRGQAILELEDGPIAGKTCVATSKSAVRHAASLSLLNRLVDGGLTLSDDTPVAAKEFLPPVKLVEAPDGGNSSCRWASMSPHAFLGALTESADLSNPDLQLVDHTLQRARAGLLDDKQLAVVLFRTRSAVWDEVRCEGVHAATRIPVMLPYVLNQYAALTGVPTGQYEGASDQAVRNGLRSASSSTGACARSVRTLHRAGQHASPCAWQPSANSRIWGRTTDGRTLRSATVNGWP
ncbi:hypothetical protein L3Q67_25485 [Saccharothrix sp. AJ9571]|nr:hypothetical protein L3Q67_25485 [Saccharothrix sp. AJ9571]